MYDFGEAGERMWVMEKTGEMESGAVVKTLKSGTRSADGEEGKELVTKFKGR